MKKWIALFLCIGALVHADGETNQPPERKYNKAILEARASYFLPFSHTFRSLTGNGGVNWALESTAPVWKGLNIWSGVDYFSKGGKMQGGINRSVHVTMVPITLGLKYVYPFLVDWSVYGGIGCKYYLVEVVNRSPALNRTIFRSGPGGVAELGVMVRPVKHLIIDLFTSASYKRLSGPSHPKSDSSSYTMNLSGFNIGGGIGYEF